MTFYSAGECTVCDQGRLTLARARGTHKILVYCDECEVAWPNPEAAMSPDEGRPLEELAPSGVDFPARAELEAAGLAQYIKEEYSDGE